MSIRTKLLLAVIGTLVITGSLTAVFIYNENNKKLVLHANEDVRQTIDYTLQLINLYFGRLENNLSNLAVDPVIISALKSKDPGVVAQATDKMTVVNEALGEIIDIGLHKIIGTKCVNIAADARASSTVGQDFSDRDYCQGVIKTKSLYLSSAYISSISKKPTLGIVVPVKNSYGEMLGYVLGTVDLSVLRGYLWDLQAEGSAVDLLDRYGVIFLTTKENINTLSNKPSAEEREVAEVGKMILAGNYEGFFQQGGDFIGFRANSSLTVIYEQPAARLFLFSKSLNYTIIFAVLLSIIFTALIIIYFIGRVTERISRLSKISQEIASGKFAIKLEKKDLEAKDETAVLARAFNEMATKLADIYKNLERKVKERTAEVEEKNKKMAESEDALKKALEIAEESNKLMVGRELKMVELKKEIANLKSSLGKK